MSGPLAYTGSATPTTTAPVESRALLAACTAITGGTFSPYAVAPSMSGMAGTFACAVYFSPVSQPIITAPPFAVGERFNRNYRVPPGLTTPCARLRKTRPGLPICP